MFILKSFTTYLWWKQAMGFRFFKLQVLSRKNVKRLKQTKNLSKNHQVTRNQPEPRQYRPGHEQSTALINFSTSFFIYLAFGKGREYAIFQISTFVGYNFQQTVQVMVILWKRHDK